MATGNVTAGAGLDHEAIAKGIGELKVGGGSTRVLGPNGKTLAYLKSTRLAVPAALVGRLPKKLGSAVVEANGRWANVGVDGTAAARAVLEYVAAQAATQTQKEN